MASASQNVAELDAGLSEELGQVPIAGGAQLGNDLLPAVGDLRPNVFQDQGLRLTIHFD